MIKLIVRIAYIASMLVQGVLITRIVLIAIKANMTNSFASFIEKYADILVKPFEGILQSTLKVNGIEIPLVLFASLIIYVVASFVLGEILKTFSKEG